MTVRANADVDCRDNDRRRSPRFSCGGHAKISSLPSDGIFLPGKILDLSLHGCCVATALPMDRGVRAEIVVRVSAALFRALGEVRAIRGRSGAGIEFVQLSTGGKDLLADLIAELARLQVVMKNLRSVRRERDTESFRRELEAGKLQAPMLSERLRFVGTILCGERSEPKAAKPAWKDLIVEAEPFVIPVDLFV